MSFASAGWFSVISAGLPKPCFFRIIKPLYSSSRKIRVALWRLRWSLVCACSKVIDLDDVPVNQHFPGIRAEIVCPQLAHFVLDEIQFLLVQADFLADGSRAIWHVLLPPQFQTELIIAFLPDLQVIRVGKFC